MHSGRLLGRTTSRWALVLLVLNLALIGTGVGAAAGRSTGKPHAHILPGGVTRTRPPSSQPSPRPTVTLPPQTNFTVGQTATVTDAATGAVLQITVGPPKVATGAISSYAYGPQEGLYLSFPVTVRNSGSVPVLVHVLDFVVDEPGLPGRTVYDGNSPFSGAPQQLDNTVLAPGQQVSGILTYDEPRRHGRLRWVTGGVTACSWSF